MNEMKMFCFQCQETARGKGCTVKGVCGKEPETSERMDMLLTTVRGVGTLAHILKKYDKARAFLTDALFTTITNANFDNNSIEKRINSGMALLQELKKEAISAGLNLPDYPELGLSCTDNACMETSRGMGVMRNRNEDIRSLKELTMYGLKGMAAYYEHASRLGYENEQIIAFMCHALAMITNPNVPQEELLALVLDTGKHGVEVMALLDKANTGTFGNPVITQVNTGARNNPSILISGHDLKDIEELLHQTVGTGIDVYTHSEMLSAHYYPELKQYPHLVGNYGNAWWQQREEFELFNGPIVFTTNCIVPPPATVSYSKRVFTTNSTGFPGWKHIPTDAKGHKDFSQVIAMAKDCPPPVGLEEGFITGGFAHNQVIELAEKITQAVKSGAIKRFIVMSGCDGRMKSRQYYTDFAKALPYDTVILTSGCAKYRYIKLPLGTINGIPRILDAGQCNDSYSWVLVALALKDILNVKDINDLPITFNIAWYEQKAVIVLLALLSLGIKNIHIGPTLPAFVSPNILKVLTEKFGLAGISSVKEDLCKFKL